MSNYPIEELIARWKREELTAEQAIGQVLQVLHAQQQRLRALERRLPRDDGGAATPVRRQRA